MRRAPLPSAALAIALLFAHAAVPPAARAQRFDEEISVTEVEIPVQVLRGGRPVAGLTAEDFEVFDGGERREIVGFRVIDLTRVAPGPGAADGAAAPAGPAQASPALEAEGRRFLLLFDFLFSHPQRLRRALPGAREMLVHQLHPADRVAVAYLTGGGANVVLGFTRERDEIEAALGVVEGLLGRSQTAVTEGLKLLARAQGRSGEPNGEPNGEPAGEDGLAVRPAAAVLAERFGPAAAVAMLGGADPAVAPEDAPAFGSGMRVNAVAFDDGDSFGPIASRIAPVDPFAIGASMAEAADTSAIRTLSQEIGRLGTLLRDVPGQKQMLYFSQGFDSGILETFDSGSRALALRYLETMFEALRRSGWTLHAVDVEGIPDPFSGPGFRAHALYYMANETGGQLFENYNRVHQATEKLVERTSLTYVLTIHPGELAANGRLHRLEVRLKDRPRGTRVLHRTGYYAPKPEAAKSPLERQLDSVDLLLGKEEVRELAARVRAGALPPDGGLVPVPVVIEIPAGDLVGERASGVLELDLQLYAVDDRDGVQDVWIRNLRLQLDEVGEVVARGGLRVLGGLALPPGDYRLRALVRDPETGRSSLSTTPFTAPADGGPLPLDPVIIDRSGDWLELVALPAGPGGAPGDALSFGPTFVVPPVAPTIREAHELEFLVVTPEGEEVELSGRLFDAGGPVAAAGATVVFFDRLQSRDERLVRHLGRATTAELAPGAYRLEVSATDAAGALLASRSLAFEVRD